MNLLKHSAKYNKYLDRINDYKLIADKNEAFSSIEARVSNLHQDLKSNNNKQYYNTIYWGLLSLSIVISCICFVKGMYLGGIASLAAVVISKYLFTHTLKSFIQDSNIEHKKVEEESAFDMKLYHQMKYIQDGIEIKIARISLVRNSFMALFAICMICGIGLLNIEVETSFIVSAMFAGMISCGFWFYFFKDDLDVLEFQGLELNEYISAVETKWNLNTNNAVSNEMNHEVVVQENQNKDIKLQTVKPNEVAEPAAPMKKRIKITKKPSNNTSANSESNHTHEHNHGGNDNEEITEVIPPMKRDKSPLDIYKQLSLDV